MTILRIGKFLEWNHVGEKQPELAPNQDASKFADEIFCLEEFAFLRVSKYLRSLTVSSDAIYQQQSLLFAAL